MCVCVRDLVLAYTGILSDSFNTHQVWAKYEAKVKEELQAQGKVVLDDSASASASSSSSIIPKSKSKGNGGISGRKASKPVGRRELNRLVALRILEKSCETNPGFDRFTQVERAKAALLAQAQQAQQQQQQQQVHQHQQLSPLESAAASSAAAVEVRRRAGADEGEGVEDALMGAVNTWAAKSSPLYPLLDHFARLAKGTGGLL